MQQVQIRSEFSVKTQNTHFCSSLGLLSQLLRCVVFTYISSPTRMSVLFDTTFHQYQMSKLSVQEMFTLHFDRKEVSRSDVKYDDVPICESRDISKASDVKSPANGHTFLYIDVTHTFC